MLFQVCPIFNDMFFMYNPVQNIWKKVKKSSKIGQEQKSLITASAQFLIAINKIFFLEERIGTRLFPPNFNIFLIFLNFQRYLVW